jgi:DNA replication protein DnaC
MTEKLTKLSDVKTNVFKRIADRKKAENPNFKPVKTDEDDLYYLDSKGRTCVKPTIHKQMLENDKHKKALLEHGNDKNKRLDLCGFPKKDREFMFKYDYQSVLKSFTGLDVKNSSWIFIYGAPGTGKTTLAERLVWEWMKPKPERYATFLSVRDWIQDQYNSFKTKDNNETPEIPQFKKYIILDDFDKVHFTEWQMLQIFRLIDYLDRNNRKVIITSNHSISELLEKSKYDMNYKATLDRILGRTKKAILGMDGKSFRNENFQLF